MKKTVKEIVPEIQMQLKELYRGSGPVIVGGVSRDRNEEIKRLEGRLEGFRDITDRLVNDNETHAIGYYSRKVSKENKAQDYKSFISELQKNPRPLAQGSVERKKLIQAIKTMGSMDIYKLELDIILPD